MRSREEVLREFNVQPDFTGMADCPYDHDAMADRIRELEAPRGEAVAWWVDHYGNRLVTFDVKDLEVWRAFGYTPSPLYATPPTVRVTEGGRDA